MNSTGLDLKNAGIKRVSENNEEFLEMMRKEARRIARAEGNCSTDELHKFSEKMDIYPKHPNAFGAIFYEGSEWFPVGYKKSTRPQAHARVIRTWALRKQWKF